MSDKNLSDIGFGKADENKVINALDSLTSLCTCISTWAGWWPEADADAVLDFGPSSARVYAEKLCLIHSEVSEALEEVRKPEGLNGPSKQLLGEELADVIIRVIDLCGNAEIDIATAIISKCAKNYNRPYRHGNKRL